MWVAIGEEVKKAYNLKFIRRDLIGNTIETENGGITIEDS